MNAPERFFMPDIQSTPDHRQLAIQQVGVKGLRYPLALVDAAGEAHATVATMAMTVGLPPEAKGTHMSRFVEMLERERPALSLRDLRQMFAEMLVHLQANSGRIELRFPYFIRKAAPVSGVASLLDIDAGIDVWAVPGGAVEMALAVTVPVTSLCPCSKEISAYGAHNQRSHLSLRVQLRADMTLEELVRIAEEQASCEVFGLLKRPDEKWVTERAYDNPKFVEDLVRDIALRLQDETRIGAWSVASENFESIHNHSAYALIEGRNV
ncbi:MAG: GTP cyclohydrolase I FolE2 [Betaproteobacteria bacterium]|nr:GTP cyclohydrolase I FolE2 [Betaproteobacteria bacterium]